MQVDDVLLEHLEVPVARLPVHAGVVQPDFRLFFHQFGAQDVRPVLAVAQIKALGGAAAHADDFGGIGIGKFWTSETQAVFGVDKLRVQTGVVSQVGLVFLVDRQDDLAVLDPARKRVVDVQGDLEAYRHEQYNSKNFPEPLHLMQKYGKMPRSGWRDFHG